MSQLNAERVVSAMDQLLRVMLRERTDLAESIAVVAEWVAASARGIAGPTQALERSTPEPSTTAPVSHMASLPASIVEAAPANAPEIAEAPTIEVHRPQLPRSAAFVPLKLGDQVVQLKVPGTSPELAAARRSIEVAPSEDAAEPAWQGPDLGTIAERCELKAEACQTYIERRAAKGTYEEPQHVERIKGLIARGKAMHLCYLWMVNPHKPQPSDESLRIIAENYQNLARASRLAERVPVGAGERRKAALQLLAEAQSALRIAMQESWLTSADQDQSDAYQLLAEWTRYEGVFLQRHMRLDDAADPAAWQDLRTRLEAAVREQDSLESHGKKSTALLNRLAYHVKRIINERDTETGPDWLKVEDAMAQLEKVGIGAHDPRIADRLELVKSRLPQDIVVPRVRAALTEHEEDEDAGTREYSENVSRVRAMLEGSRIVLIGGEPRTEAVQRIEAAFGLEECEWTTAREHASSGPLEAPIRRADTRLVLILIGLASHQHVEDVSTWCTKYGKPLVRLPGKGYNPERIAAEVLEQVSDRLGGGK